MRKVNSWLRSTGKFLFLPILPQVIIRGKLAILNITRIFKVQQLLSITVEKKPPINGS